MDMPPSRYKVVEQGRRLVVIDTYSGRPASAPVQERMRAPARTVEAARDSRSAARQPPPRGSAPAGLDSAKILTTQRWFDDKAPRRVILDETGGGSFGIALAVILGAIAFAFVLMGWPVLVIGGVLLFNGAARAALRKASTRWLDGLDQL